MASNTEKPSKPYRTTLVEAGNIGSDDIVIALMGPTGSGKSQIIDSLTGQKSRAGISLKSVTDKVSAHRVLGHEIHGDKLVLVDTPGFDDTHKSDKEILKMISEWMTKTYKQHHKTLTGILYIHRITDVRMSGTPHRNLRMFGELCGDKSARNVVLLTTMWDKARNTADAVKRETGLKERYWNAMIHHGATVDRFYKNGPVSPWQTIDRVVQQHEEEALLLQEEMVDIGKRLNETNAGKALYRDLQALLEKQNKTIKSLEDQTQGGKTDADVQAEMDALRVEADRIVKEFESMKIPLGRKIALFFKKKGDITFYSR